MNGDYLNTNAVYTGIYTEVSGSTNIINYTNTTENTVAPISSFSNIYWNYISAGFHE